MTGAAIIQRWTVPKLVVSPLCNVPSYNGGCICKPEGGQVHPKADSCADVQLVRV